MALKPREARRKVVIPARMRSGMAWSDACILNLSSRGMLVQASRVPARGSYLELRRGPYVIVARVVWSQGGRFGVQTQDPVPAEGLIARGQPPVPASGEPFVGRRAAPGPPRVPADSSRRRGQAFEFASLIFAGGAAAAMIWSLVGESLFRALAAVGIALDG